MSALPKDMALLEIIFENMHMPIAYMDAKFNFLCVNTAYAQADNKTSNYFIGKNHFSLFPNTENHAIFQQVVQSGQVHYATAKPFEYENNPERGLTHWDWSLTPIKDEHGIVGNVLMQLIDVTQHVNTEISLVKEKKFAKSVLQKLEEQQSKLEELVEQRTLELQTSLQKLENENKERLRTEQSLIKAKEEAERANQSKSLFLSRMSHELRTPLNAILGFSQLLQSDNLTADQQAFVNETLSAGYHLQGLIEDVLDLSKIEAGKYSVNLTDISLSVLINESLSLVRNLADTHQICLNNIMPANDSILIRGDHIRLKEVLENLLTNAIKYNLKGGKVTLNYLLQDNDRIRITVADTGKGISETDQKEIFQPFNRLGAEHSDIEGSGIGLTIAKQLMKLMNGDIGIKSKPGNGATFWLDCQLSKVSNL